MTAGRNWPGWEAEQGWRLASREQPGPMCDRGQALSTSGSGKRDAGRRRGSSSSEGTTAGRNQPSQGKGRRMPAGGEGAAQAVSEIGHLRGKEKGCWLAMREGAAPARVQRPISGKEKTDAGWR